METGALERLRGELAHAERRIKQLTETLETVDLSPGGISEAHDELVRAYMEREHVQRALDVAEQMRRRAG